MKPGSTGSPYTGECNPIKTDLLKFVRVTRTQGACPNKAYLPRLGRGIQRSVNTGEYNPIKTDLLKFVRVTRTQGACPNKAYLPRLGRGIQRSVNAFQLKQCFINRHITRRVFGKKQGFRVKYRIHHSGCRGQAAARRD